MKEVLSALPKAGADISEVYLHVHVGNDDAVRFYEKLGFTRGEKLVGYYTRRQVEPPDAYILSLKVDNSAAAAAAAAAAAPAPAPA